MGNPAASRLLVNSLELYATVVAYLAVTAGLLELDHLAVELGLKGAAASIFAGLLKSERFGRSTVLASAATSASIALFYLIGFPNAVVSSSSYILLTVLAVITAKIISGSGEILYSLLSKSVPLFYAATAYAHLSPSLDKSRAGLVLSIACSALFVLLSVLAPRGTLRVGSVKVLSVLAAKYLRGVGFVSSTARIIVWKRVTVTLSGLLSIKKKALFAVRKGALRALGVLLSAWRGATTDLDRAMLAMGMYTLSLVRGLWGRSRRLETSVGALTHKLSRAVELLQESLESSLLLLLLAMSVFVLISLIVYVLLAS